jgi:hypothetical protein
MSYRLRIEHPPGYEQERSYIFHVILSDFLGLEYRTTCQDRRDVRVTLDGQDDGKELVCADGLFQTAADRWLTPASLPEPGNPLTVRPSSLVPDADLLHPVPAIYRDPQLADFATDSAITTSLDVFGSAFFMLSRYEEVVVRDRDSHERFASASSYAGKTGLIERPIVNEYLELLWAMIARLWPEIRRKQRTHRISLSHDVDWPLCTAGRPAHKAARTIVADVLARKSPGLAVRRSLSYLQSLRGSPGTDLCNTFDFIMDTNERHRVSTAFYFIAGRTAGEIDGCYSLDDRWIKSLMSGIHERGHEIGLHPSYETFRDPVQTRKEFEILRAATDSLGIEQERWGGRQHFLRWENPTTWRAWETAGLDYDSTLGFSDQAGFRCGVCYDFPVFDLIDRKQLNLREHPLLAMEVTLTGYMGLSWEDAVQQILELGRTCRRYAGEMTLLWHNNYLVTPAERRAYEAALEGLAS